MTSKEQRKSNILAKLSRGLLYSAPLMMVMGAAPAVASISFDQPTNTTKSVVESGEFAVAEAAAEGEAEAKAEGEAEAEAEAEGEAEGEAEAEAEAEGEAEAEAEAEGEAEAEAAN